MVMVVVVRWFLVVLREGYRAGKGGKGKPVVR